MRCLNVAVIGTGMYVCGRGTDGYGTIMPAICEWSRKNSVGELYLAGTNPESIKLANGKIGKLKEIMGVELSVKYFPSGDGCDSQAYKDAIRKIPKPAVCIVAVPDALHKEIAAFAIENGLHTLVVKPLAPTLKEVEDLIELQEQKKVYCAVEFHKRLDNANLKLKDTLAQGLIGSPLYFLVEYSQRKSIPSETFRKWVERTNIFQYLGIHYLDIIYFVTQAVPKRTMAIGQKEWLVSKGIDTYDSIQVVTEWETPSGKKFSSNILTNWIDPETTSAMSDQKIKVIGTKGRLESDQKDRSITIVSDDKGIEEPNLYFCASYGQDGSVRYKGYGIENIRQFLDDAVGIEQGELTIEELEDIRPTFKQSLVPTAILEGVNESLKRDGEWVEILNPR